MKINTHSIGLARSCRDANTVIRIQQNHEQYGLPLPRVFENMCYFRLLDAVIREAEEDFVVVMHDDVFPPISLLDRVAEAIDRLNSEFGSEGWGCAGNAGVEVLTRRVSAFLWDPHPANRALQYTPSRPMPALHIDGNCMLLNIKALRAAGVTLPADLSGFQMYDLALTIECWAAGLVVAIDHGLYVVHMSKGSQSGFDEAMKSPSLNAYLASRFVDRHFETLNGLVSVNQNLESIDPLGKPATRRSFLPQIENVLRMRAQRNEKPHLSFVVRTCLKNPGTLKRLLQTISLTSKIAAGQASFSTLIISNGSAEPSEVLKTNMLEWAQGVPVDITHFDPTSSGGRFPRVEALYRSAEALALSPRSHGHVMVIDDDDFVLPPAISRLVSWLDPREGLIFDGIIFQESLVPSSDVPLESIPAGHLDGSQWFKCLEGINYVPVCCAIYPQQAFVSVFQKAHLRNDYFEDYGMFLYAMHEIPFRHAPVKAVGVSRHGANTVVEADRTHWNYSLATLLADLHCKNTIPKVFADYVHANMGGTDIRGTPRRLPLLSLDRIFHPAVVHHIRTRKLFLLFIRLGGREAVRAFTRFLSRLIGRRET